jgi:hypothetical protein
MEYCEHEGVNRHIEGMSRDMDRWYSRMSQMVNRANISPSSALQKPGGTQQGDKFLV